MRLALVLFISLILSQFAIAADTIHLYEWTPGNTLAPILLPVRNSETPEVAAQRYLRELSKNSELMELFEGRLPDLPLQGFKLVDENARESRALLIANVPKDYTQKSQRLINFKKIFKQMRQQTYILPINANLGLNIDETREVFKKISSHFPLLVALGGDDVDPELYKKENFHSRNTNKFRDQFEVNLIKSYVAQEKGFLLGVCRGSQITSVALGYQMLQDVPFHMGTDVAHGNDWHPVKVQETPSNLLRSLADKEGRLFVNSLHHQSVIFKEGGPLQIAARSDDGVTEATEFKNGRGLLLQFHPELMNNELGSKILWKVVHQKNLVMPLRCSKIFSF